jgi:hypothetical protein
VLARPVFILKMPGTWKLFPVLLSVTEMLMPGPATKPLLEMLIKPDKPTNEKVI